MITYASCPVCDQQEFTDFLTCQDYTVSNEKFHLVQCTNCTFIFTNPQPDTSKLGDYYKSSAYISHSGKASTITDHLYLWVRKKALRWKLSLLPKKPGNLLDYGCGTGEFLKTCKDSGWNISGVEPSENARSKAQQLTGASICRDLEDSLIKFDAITLWHVLEHISDLNSMVSRFRRILTDDGKMLIAVPNYKSYDAQHYKQYWAGYDVPRHLWHFSQSTMHMLLEKNGLTIADIIPMKLDAFYVSLLSEKYMGTSITFVQLINAYITGLRSNLKAKAANEYSSLIYLVQKK